jgi:hypothetical protein
MNSKGLFLLLHCETVIIQLHLVTELLQLMLDNHIAKPNHINPILNKSIYNQLFDPQSFLFSISIQ